jgi:hypothetical protein
VPRAREVQGVEGAGSPEPGCRGPRRSGSAAARWSGRWGPAEPKPLAGVHGVPGDQEWSGKRDSNPRLRPWQGRTLPLSYSRSQSTPQSTQQAVGRATTGRRRRPLASFGARPGDDRPKGKVGSSRRTRSRSPHQRPRARRPARPIGVPARTMGPTLQARSSQPRRRSRVRGCGLVGGVCLGVRIGRGGRHSDNHHDHDEDGIADCTAHGSVPSWTGDVVRSA